MSEFASKAVFLSYASQDAAAVQRIAEALRAAGAEVWFDQNELVGGDAWDQKIRRQIKECALFVPVISANTNARAEGYFRLEWKLAVDRSHLMADDAPFLFPVVIDDTSDATARVPDKFREVQWTRLNIKDTPESLARRVARILGGAAPAEASPAASRRPAAPSEPGGNRSRFWAWFGYACGIGGLVLGVMFAFREVWPRRLPGAKAGAAEKSVVPASNEAERTIARAYALFEKMSYTRSNLTAAEDLLRKLTEQASDSARAWGARAYVGSCFILRGWDTSQQRREAAQEYANRALALDANETEAMLALTYVLNQQGAFAQSEAMARRALAIHPDDARLRRTMGAAILGAGRFDEALAYRRESARLFPRDPLIFYDLGLMQRTQGDMAGALANFEQAIALQPFASALLQRTMLIAAYRGDLAEARSTLDRLEPEDRTEDRAVGVAEWLGLLEHRPDRVREAAALTAHDYLDDSVARGAKASWVALAYQLEGKDALARQQWEVAESVLRRRQTERGATATSTDYGLWAQALARLGRNDEAARAIAAYEAAALEQPVTSGVPPQALLAFFYAATGDAAKAVSYAKVALNRTHYITDYTVALDPQWDKIRASPEFPALLAEAKTRIAAGAPLAAPATTASPARELAEKARGLLQGLEATRDDFALAEDYCKRALALDSSDGVVLAIYAELCSAFGYRGWDTSPERREQTRVLAERAIRLAPDAVEAKLAQAGAWSTFGVNRPGIEKILRDILAEQPGNREALRFLAVTVLPRSLDECLALNERAAALPGGDPLALFNNARYLWQRGRGIEACATLQRCLAQKTFGSALVLKLMMDINVRGDLAEAEATLQRIPPAMQLEDRANFLAGLLRFDERQPAAALEIWKAFPRDFYSDFVFDGPRGLLVGLADELAHRDAAAKIEWRTALQSIEKQIAAAPNGPRPYLHQAYLLACLGEKAAAEEVLRTYEQLAGVNSTPAFRLPFELALVYTRLGRLDDIFAHPPSDLDISRLRFDPRFDTLRADPRFEKLRARLPQQTTEAKK